MCILRANHCVQSLRATGLVTHEPMWNEWVLEERVHLVPLDAVSEVVEYSKNIFFDREFFTEEEYQGEIDSNNEAEAKLYDKWVKRKAKNDKEKRQTRPYKRTLPEMPVRRGTKPEDMMHWPFIVRVILMDDGGTRSIRLSHPLSAELELRTYGRAHLIAPQKTLSVPHIDFVDAFGLYRNMYRSLTGVYLIPANISLRERTRLVNIFPVTLGPHGTNIQDVFGAISHGYREVERGIQVEIQGEMQRVFAPALGYLGDMPQQADSMGFMRSNAILGCRACFITIDKYGNLDYDVVKRGRYHDEVLRARDIANKIPTLKRRTDYLNALGMNENAPSILKLSPAIDLVKGAPADPPHADCQGE